MDDSEFETGNVTQYPADIELYKYTLENAEIEFDDVQEGDGYCIYINHSPVKILFNEDGYLVGFEVV